MESRAYEYPSPLRKLKIAEFLTDLESEEVYLQQQLSDEVYITCVHPPLI